MSPRPRKISDEEVFAATYRAMGRLGPGDLTLAEIAAEAGVTAAALSQRFGSKRQLLLALARGAAASAGGFIRELSAARRSPLAAVRASAPCSGVSTRCNGLPLLAKPSPAQWAYLVCDCTARR